MDYPVKLMPRGFIGLMLIYLILLFKGSETWSWVDVWFKSEIRGNVGNEKKINKKINLSSKWGWVN